ncbi:hypothetical protein [Hymenobacter terrestris]|uniref:DUF3592 domain-containing protein n=1 Tax=Hymenobacter terrestris TaxID=2748310 RepID=A0ABX2PYG2_9BACT|nr:hypothetical protein [Hymenobacter terrestris]NVO83733.1 hypothetical protein [Hymenobacter terrestris]
MSAKIQAALGILMVVGFLVLSIRTSRQRADLLGNGVCVSGVVKDSYYLKSTWKTKVALLYEGRIYENDGVASEKYKIGDSIRVKILPNDPDGLILISDSEDAICE